MTMKHKRLIYYKACHPEYGTWFFTTKTKLAVILRLKSPYIYTKYKRAYTNDDPKTGSEIHYLNGWAIEELRFAPDAPISKLNPNYDRVYDVEKWREDDFKEKHPLYCYEDAI